MYPTHYYFQSIVEKLRQWKSMNQTKPPTREQLKTQNMGKHLGLTWNEPSILPSLLMSQSVSLPTP